MPTIKVTTVGSSIGIVLPKDILAKLRVGRGDLLYASETPDGIQLVPFDPELAKQLEMAEEIMRKDRDVLRKLKE